MPELDERQTRELEYHRQHASQNADVLGLPFDWSVLERPSRRWWNAYWRMYDVLLKLDVAGKKTLVVGCGFGEEALRLAKAGADVTAFDLSPESLAIAARLAEREKLTIRFDAMPAESLGYPDGSFDIVVARDILHHVDIGRSVAELLRVAKPDAKFVINEIYSHSMTEVIRRSAFVEGFLYPRMKRLIYGTGKPYITADERKLTEKDIEQVQRGLVVESRSYFNFLVTRLIPDRYDVAAQADRLLLRAVGSAGRWLGGRVLIVARKRSA